VNNGLKYPKKILVAWAEAISGNSEIRDWLIKNGYQELGLFTFALRNMDDARMWLMENGYPHLLALINGIEGNLQALQWLEANDYKMLSIIAHAADGKAEPKNWLIENDKVLAMLALKMEYIKDEIERENNDAHKISPH
jgi:hypothetical protein